MQGQLDELKGSIEVTCRGLAASEVAFAEAQERRRRLEEQLAMEIAAVSDDEMSDGYGYGRGGSNRMVATVDEPA